MFLVHFLSPNEHDSTRQCPDYMLPRHAVPYHKGLGFSNDAMGSCGYNVSMRGNDQLFSRSSHRVSIEANDVGYSDAEELAMDS